MTDANLVLGLFDPGRKLGGEIDLQIDAARKAIREHASPSGREQDAVKDAWGIYRVVTSAMADAIENFLVSKGFDPRHYALVAYGAAGGMHAAAIADRLRMRRVIIPNFFPVFSAFGLMATDIRHAYSLTDDSVKVVLDRQADAGFDKKAAVVSEKLRRVTELPMRLLEAEGIPEDRRAVQLFLDMRFSGQVLELAIPVSPQVLSTDLDGGDFKRLLDEWLAKYRRVYGSAAIWNSAEVEIINYRAVGIGRIDRLQLTRMERPAMDPAIEAPRRRRQIYLGKWYEADILDERALAPGLVINGPAVLQGDLRTVVLGDGDIARVDDIGNLLITPGGNWGWR